MAPQKSGGREGGLQNPPALHSLQMCGWLPSPLPPGSIGVKGLAIRLPAHSLPSCDPHSSAGLDLRSNGVEGSEGEPGKPRAPQEQPGSKAMLPRVSKQSACGEVYGQHGGRNPTERSKSILCAAPTPGRVRGGCSTTKCSGELLPLPLTQPSPFSRSPCWAETPHSLAGFWVPKCSSRSKYFTMSLSLS